MGVKIVYSKSRRPAFLLLMVLFVICAAGAAAAADGSDDCADGTIGTPSEQLQLNDLNKGPPGCYQPTDVSIDKEIEQKSVAAGENVCYDITVKNLGRNAAKNVVVTDEVNLVNPQYRVMVDNTYWSDPSPWTGSFSCKNLEAKSLYIHIWGIVPSSQPEGWMYNTATVSADNDPWKWNNMARDKVYVYTKADLAMEKTAPETVNAGEEIAYHINIKNNGPSDAQNVVLKDSTLPDLLTGAYYKVKIGDGEWGAAVPWTPGSDILLGVIQACQTVYVDIFGTVPSSTAKGTVINNEAFVESSTCDPCKCNNHACTTTTVDTQADVYATKSDTGSDPVTAGTNMVYTIVIGNNGPSDAVNVLVEDTLHEWLSGATFTVDGGTAQPWTGSYTIALLKAGEKVNIVITGLLSASAPTGSVIENKVTALAETADPNLLNNIGYAATGVKTIADLSVTKTVPATVTAGANIIYTIVVTNNGPSDAQNVVLNDVLPSWITGATYTKDGVDMGAWTSPLVLGLLEAGKSVTIIINGTVDAATPDATELNNTANVTSDTPDSNSTNNEASGSTIVSNPTSGGGGVTPESGGEGVNEPVSGGEAVSAGTVGMQTTGSPVALLVMALLVLLSGLFGIRKP